MPGLSSAGPGSDASVDWVWIDRPGLRVRLQPLCGDDASALVEVLGDAEVMRHWSHAPLRSAADIDWYLRDAAAGARSGSHWRWAIRRSDDDLLVGIASLHGFDRPRRQAEVSYALACRHWGQGLATEALQLLLAHAFDRCGLQSLEARVDPANRRSRRLLARLGFHPPDAGSDAATITLRLDAAARLPSAPQA